MRKVLEVVTPRQSNYDTYFLPDEVRDIGKNVPLYRLVSYWVMRTSSYVCRDDIAQAFGISLRQASGLISAITRKREEISCSLKRIRAGKGNVVKSYIFIQHVFEKVPKIRAALTTPNLPRKVKEKQAHHRGKSLWSQLLSRSSIGVIDTFSSEEKAYGDVALSVGAH